MTDKNLSLYLTAIQTRQSLFCCYSCFLRLAEDKIIPSRLQGIARFSRLAEDKMSSVFHTSPAPASPGYATVGEQDGELIHVRLGQTRTKFQGYPEVTITKESTRSLTQRENAKSAFLPHDETVSKRAYHAWYEMGLSGALEEIVNSAEEGK